jgi:hypothetical protein
MSNNVRQKNREYKINFDKNIDLIKNNLDEIELISHEWEMYKFYNKNLSLEKFLKNIPENVKKIPEIKKEIVKIENMEIMQ